MRRMVCDVPNLFFRCIAASKNSKITLTPEEQVMWGLHSCLISLRKHYNQIKPNQLAVVFEGSRNWRKTYTYSEECYSKRGYKANRVKDPSMQILFDVMDKFKDLVKNYTSLVVLHNEELEGDDCVTAYVNRFKNQDQVFIVSSDKDFSQLIEPNVILINPETSQPRTLVEVCGVDSAEYFIFEKCFRGDSGDNVISALPRVRATALQKSWGVGGEPDLILLNSLLEKTWDLPSSEEGVDSRSMHVGTLFEENNLLMNLNAQPEHIKLKMNDTVEQALANKTRYDHFKIMKFLAEMELFKIADDIDNFIPMLSNTGFQNQELTTKPKPKVGGFNF